MIRTSELVARRDAFRQGILAEAQSTTATMLGAMKPGLRIVDIPLMIGARGVALAANDHVFFRLGLNGVVTVLTWSLAGTVGGVSTAGSVTVNILVGATLAGAASICGTHLPALVSSAELDEQSPAVDWTVQISDPLWIMAKVTVADAVLEVVSLTLRCAVGSR